MNTTTLISTSHPAERALADALASTGGALDESRVGVAACIYNATLRSCDHGPFLQSPWYGHQADKPIYPASVIKLFFLDALAAFRENGMIAEDEEDDRAAAQMMAISSNEATVYLVGRLTGADDGACLQGTALEDWCAARHRVQQWYDSQNRMGLQASMSCTVPTKTVPMGEPNKSAMARTVICLHLCRVPHYCTTSRAMPVRDQSG